MAERKPTREDLLEQWHPKTELGRMVKRGDITSIEEIYKKNLSILEHEIVDYLIPNLQEEVLGRPKSVQRATGSGRKMSFFAIVAVGDKNGHIGFGTGKALEVRPSIERAVKNAKKNIMHVRRGCGSCECACGTSHSLPFKVQAKFGSAKITLRPAPKGTGVVAGKTAKKVLELAGFTDLWSRSEGSTDTKMNLAKATMKALNETRKMKLKTEVGIL